MHVLHAVKPKFVTPRMLSAVPTVPTLSVGDRFRDATCTQVSNPFVYIQNV